MTKKGSIPIKLWIDSPQEMRTISNKRAQLVELFNWLDYRGLNRVDTLHIFATILLAIEGNPETVSQNIMLFFGFRDPEKFYREEFNFFLDTLFRGLCSFVIV